jgi:mono/diheme cytochrome c family protein
MRQALFFGSFALSAVVTALACGGDNSDSGDGDNGIEAGSSEQAEGGIYGTAGTGAATGLPCDVQALIENRCIACHDGNTQGAPPLLNYPELTSPSRTDPPKSLAQEALIRMQQKTGPTTMPPPPAVGPDPDEIATFANWVNAGTPPNPMACTDMPPPAAEGGTTTMTGDGGGGVMGTCTSMMTWSGGNMASELMNPGEACMACHQQLGGPNLSFAGTVYKTSHEADLCNGVSPPPTITVTVTDKQGKTASATVNAAGNFQIAKQTPPLKAPFKAQLSDGTNTRSMMGSVTSGDCNSCHTVAGANGAPGRILAP